MTTKFTPEQLRQRSDRPNMSDTTSAMLRQASDDAERLDWLAHNFRTCSLDMGGKHRYAPSSSIGSLRGPTFIEAVDTARKELK